MTARMENARLFECLEADYRRMREIVPGHLDARVPSCPDWTVDDLTWHVGMVYLHKAVTMREGAEPKPWPPSFDDSYPALTLIDDAYRQLLGEFAVAAFGQDQAGDPQDGLPALAVRMKRKIQVSVRSFH